MGRLAMATVCSAFLLAAAGCVGGAAVAPSPPDESVLASAQEALAEAKEIGAAKFAPQALAEARRRLAAARSLLYRAAVNDRPLTQAESERVERLAAEAALDARLAYVQTQEAAVASKLAELRGQPGLNTEGQ